MNFQRASAADCALNASVRTEHSDSEGQAHAGTFATTHWSVVLAAGQGGSPGATEALENLCRTYWYPLYAYIRRRGAGHEDAQDLTQGFLLHLLKHDAFSRVEHSRGRFRSFLLASLNYYLADQRDHAGAIKRGAGQVPFSLDVHAAEERYRLEAPGNDSPDRLFERRWALALLEQVLQRLGQEFQEDGKAALFQRLQDFLVTGQAEARYPEAAADLGMSVDAVKKAAQRMRRRYYELFREEISHTVGHLGEVEEELRYLCKIIAG